MLEHERLKLLTGIRHGFFTREGGVSEGLYASRNCGPGSQDDPARVQENRVCSAAQLGGTVDRLATLYQVHGKAVHTLRAPLAGRPEGDALVTNVPGVMLGILTADCAPVLFADPNAQVIGAAHAGWKGAREGVLQATVKAMEALGAARANIIAVVGPCIAQASYEVDEAFRQRFLAQDAAHLAFFKEGAAGKSYFDLRGYVQTALRTMGVGTVDALPHDTYADASRFFSFRRTTHRGEPDYGRQLSAIVLA